MAPLIDWPGRRAVAVGRSKWDKVCRAPTDGPEDRTTPC